MIIWNGYAFKNAVNVSNEIKDGKWIAKIEIEGFSASENEVVYKFASNARGSNLDNNLTIYKDGFFLCAAFELVSYKTSEPANHMIHKLAFVSDSSNYIAEEYN